MFAYKQIYKFYSKHVDMHANIAIFTLFDIWLIFKGLRSLCFNANMQTCF